MPVALESVKALANKEFSDFIPVPLTPINVYHTYDGLDPNHTLPLSGRTPFYWCKTQVDVCAISRLLEALGHSIPNTPLEEDAMLLVLLPEGQQLGAVLWDDATQSVVLEKTLKTDTPWSPLSMDIQRHWVSLVLPKEYASHLCRFSTR